MKQVSKICLRASAAKRNFFWQIQAGDTPSIHNPKWLHEEAIKWYETNLTSCANIVVHLMPKWQMNQDIQHLPTSALGCLKTLQEIRKMQPGTTRLNRSIWKHDIDMRKHSGAYQQEESHYLQQEVDGHDVDFGEVNEYICWWVMCVYFSGMI